MQEILGTFSENIAQFRLIPGSGGQFEFVIDGDLAFSKKQEGRYPEMSELKDAVAARLS